MSSISLWIKKNTNLILLLAICTTILLSHSLYVIKTQQYPKMDEHSYMELGVAYYRILKEPSLSSPSEIMRYTQDHPPFRQPFYPLLLSFSFLLFGIENSYKTAIWLNGVFYAVSIIGIYYLGKEFLSKNAGIIASLVFAFYGFPLFYLHFTYSETVTTSFVVLTLLFLAKSKDFMLRRYSVLFALSLLVGAMTRWVVGIFLIGPIAISFVRVLLKRNKKKWSVQLRNILLIFLILLPGALFYIGNQASLRSYVGSNLHFGSKWVVEYIGNPYLKNSFSLQSFAYYFKVFEQNTIFFFLLFIMGLAYSIFKPKKYIFLILAFFVPYFFLTVGATFKADRFIIPIYPVIALITAVLIDRIKNNRARIVLIFLIIILSISNFLSASWGKGLFGSEGLKSIILPMPVGHPRLIHLNPIVWPPSKDLTRASEILDAIEKDAKKNKKEIAFLAFYNNQEINNAIYTRSNYLQEKHYRFESLQPLVGKDRYVDFFRTITETNYILVKDKRIIDNSLPPENLEVIEQVNKVFEMKGRLPSEFEEMKTIQIPFDNSKITIYKKTKEVSLESLRAYVNIITKANPNNASEINQALSKYLKERGKNTGKS